jgi:hypothetical protein
MNWRKKREGKVEGGRKQKIELKRILGRTKSYFLLTRHRPNRRQRIWAGGGG